MNVTLICCSLPKNTNSLSRIKTVSRHIRITIQCERGLSDAIMTLKGLNELNDLLDEFYQTIHDIETELERIKNIERKMFDWYYSHFTGKDGTTNEQETEEHKGDGLRSI